MAITLRNLAIIARSLKSTPLPSHLSRQLNHFTPVRLFAGNAWRQFAVTEHAPLRLPGRSWCRRYSSAKDNPGKGPKIKSREEHALAAYKAKETVTNAFTFTGLAAILGVGVVCSYFIAKELFPGDLSVNSVFNKSLEAVQKDDKVKQLFGSPIKGYGKDFGGHRVGRRNFVENISYKDDDGIEHTRILFNIEGSRGKGRVWADVSDGMTTGQFYYLIVQDKRTNELLPLIDQRPKTPEAVRLADIAELLAQKDVVLYGGSRCVYTRKQLELFGVNATKKLKFVNCDDDFQKCVDMGIEKLPTWVFKEGDMQHRSVGVKSPEDLAVMASRVKRN